MGSAGDSPARVGDPPTGMAKRQREKRVLPLIRPAVFVPSGGSPDGTGESPVLPENDFSDTLRRRINVSASAVHFQAYSLNGNLARKPELKWGAHARAVFRAVAENFERPPKVPGISTSLARQKAGREARPATPKGGCAPLDFRFPI